MTTLGAAYVDVHGDTSSLRRDIRRTDKDFDIAGETAGKRFGQGFRKGSGGPMQVFKDAISKGAMALVGLFASIAPIGPSLVGLVAGVVAVGGALSYASTAAVSFGGVLASLGPAVAVGMIAFKGMGEALGGNAKAMAKLTPEARQMVGAIKSLGSSWSEAKRQIQGNLFTGLGDQVKQLGDTNGLIDVLKGNLGQTAIIMNNAASGMLGFLNSKAGLGQLNGIFSGLNTVLASLLPALGNFGKGLLNIFTGMLGPSQALGNSILTVSQHFLKWTQQAGFTQKVSGYLKGAAGAAGDLLGILGNLGGILHAVFGAGTKGGESMLGTFKKATQSLEDLLKSGKGQAALAGFFATTGVAAKAFGDVLGVIKPIFGGLAAVFQAVAPLLNNVRAALLPIISALAKQLGAGLKSVAPLLSDIGKRFTQLLPVLGPVVKFLASTFLGAIIGAVKGALKVIDGVLTVLVGLVNFVKGVFTGNWSQAWLGIKQIFSGVWEAILGVIQFLWNVGVVKLFRSGFALIKDAVVAGWKGIVGFFESAGKGIWNAIKSVWDGIHQAFSFAFKALGSRVKAGWDVIKQVFVAAWDGLKGIVSKGVDTLKGFADKIKKFFGGIWDGFSSGAKGALNGAIKILNGFISTGNGWISKANRYLPAKWQITHIPSIPYFASGVRDFGGGLAVVGERGPEIVRLPQGSDVIPAGPSSQILNNTSNASTVNNITLNEYGPRSGTAKAREAWWWANYGAGARTSAAGGG